MPKSRKRKVSEELLQQQKARNRYRARQRQQKRASFGARVTAQQLDPFALCYDQTAIDQTFKHLRKASASDGNAALLAAKANREDEIKSKPGRRV